MDSPHLAACDEKLISLKLWFLASQGGSPSAVPNNLIAWRHVDKHGMTAQEWESKHVILDQGAFNMFQLTKMPPCQTTSLNMLPQREFRKHTYIYIYISNPGWTSKRQTISTTDKNKYKSMIQTTWPTEPPSMENMYNECTTPDCYGLCPKSTLVWGFICSVGSNFSDLHSGWMLVYVAFCLNWSSLSPSKLTWLRTIAHSQVNIPMVMFNSFL